MKITAIDVFRLPWQDKTWSHSALVRITTDDGVSGLGEVSPMQGGLEPLRLIKEHCVAQLIGNDPLDHAPLLERLYHKLIKLGPDGIVTGALAALDIALWDIKGKALGLPVYKLLGGAWRTEFPFYASIGGNAARTVDEVVRVVEQRVSRENPSAVKIRWDGRKTSLDVDIDGDIAKAKAVRRLLGDNFKIAFDANNGYSVGGAVRVGRALEELGYWWFEEPTPHYHVDNLGEVARRLDITVSAGEQTYTLQSLRQLINAGIRMVQPDIVKMGGITGMMQCATLAHASGVEFVPHQTQPVIGHLANLHLMSTVMHMTKPIELNSGWERADDYFTNPSRPGARGFVLPDAPGLGVVGDEDAIRRFTVSVG